MFRKYLMIDLYTGECTELSEDEFNQQIEGCEVTAENEHFISYKLEEKLFIEDKIAEYSE